MTPSVRRRKRLSLQKQRLRRPGSVVVTVVVTLVALSLSSWKNERTIIYHPQLPVLYVSAEDTDSNTGNCAMDIWIFSSFDSCQASDAPVANGKLYTDGLCRTIETDLDITDPNYSFFPGNYRAQCIDSNTIQFTDSACLDAACTVTSLVTSSTCDRDNTSPASLYSRLEPPQYAVQDPTNANVGAFYTCLKLDGSDVSLTFVVFGDCSQCTIAPPTAPTVPAVPAPPTAPTGTMTTAAPSTAPPAATTTAAPVSTTTTATPQTATGTSTPLGTPTNVAPILYSNTTTNAPATTGTTNLTATDAPSQSPIFIPTTTPAPVGVTTLAPTNVAPVATPTAPSVPVMSGPTKGLINDLISVAIRLSPMNETMQNSSDSISQWEAVTIDQIRSIVESEDYYLNTIIYAIDISNITQIVIDPATTTTTDGRSRRRRSLQQTSDNSTTISTGTTKTMSLQINFDVSLSYTTPSTTTTATATLANMFTSSFDTEQDRSNYLIKLVTNDDIFTSVRLVQVVYVNDQYDDSNNNNNNNNNNAVLPVAPVASPTTEITSNSSTGRSSGLLVSLAGGGTALIVFAILGIVYYQRQQHHGSNNHKSGGSSNYSKENITKEGETPSDDNDEFYGNGGPVGPLNFTNSGNHNPNSPIYQSQQRWTNEIVVDPSADDVSTLGGSVLAGYLDATTQNNNNNQNTEEDEPTASVNLDFDYNRNQYRSDAEDRSRTVFTENTGPTTFTNFTAAKLGMNGEATIQFTDDVSFEELYADFDDTNDTQNDINHNSKTIKNQSHMGKIATMVKPFEVRAPPGKLGMVVDTPNGGVPVVRAIKSDSALNGNVMVGDRLISVDHKDVTNMSALEVSSLISIKQHQHRLLVFCRLQQQQPTPIVTTTTATTPQSTVHVQPSPVGTEMAISS